MARNAMAIDLDLCVGCQTCAMVCKIHHACGPRNWWNRVATIGTATHQASVLREDGKPHMDFLPISCQHCENAPCQRVCPTGATYTNDDGTVLVDYNKCIGCRFCISACPYGVRQFNWVDAKAAKHADGWVTNDYGYPFDYQDGNHLVYTQFRPKGVTEKCTLCVEYTSQGILPACVRACPQKARIYGDLDDATSEIAQLAQTSRVVKLHEEYATSPKVFYLIDNKEVLANA